jgi:hypothetical protein
MKCGGSEASESRQQTWHHCCNPTNPTNPPPVLPPVLLLQEGALHGELEDLKRRIVTQLALIVADAAQVGDCIIGQLYKAACADAVVESTLTALRTLAVTRMLQLSCSNLCLVTCRKHLSPALRGGMLHLHPLLSSSSMVSKLMCQYSGGTASSIVSRVAGRQPRLNVILPLTYITQLAAGNFAALDPAVKAAQARQAALSMQVNHLSMSSCEA